MKISNNKIWALTTSLLLFSCVPEGTQDTKEAQDLAKAIQEGKIAVGATSMNSTSTTGSTVSTVPTTTTSTTTTGGVVVVTTTSALSSVTAFQQTVYPLSLKYCTSCHISSNQPFFANSDVVKAHDALISQNKVNFTDPASSRMVDRLLRDGHHCWSNCTADAQEMLAAINNWKTLKTPVVTTTTVPANSTTTSTARMATINMLVPANLSTGGDAAANFMTLTYTLANATDTINPDIAGATFTIEIQKFDDFSYRVRNPKIITLTSAVSVKDIRIAVNGMIRPGDATYSLVERAVATGAAGTVLSTTPMIMLIDKGAGQDQISISFASIAKM